VRRHAATAAWPFPCSAGKLGPHRMARLARGFSAQSFSLGSSRRPATTPSISPVTVKVAVPRADKLEATVPRQAAKREQPVRKRPPRVRHFGSVSNPKTFSQAFAAIAGSPGAVYSTLDGKAFSAEARTVRRGLRAGERVITFKQHGSELARAYECCWDHRTNCNRACINDYSSAV
jgi:hypothetical protein